MRTGLFGVLFGPYKIPKQILKNTIAEREWFCEWMNGTVKEWSPQTLQNRSLYNTNQLRLTQEVHIEAFGNFKSQSFLWDELKLQTL